MITTKESLALNKWCPFVRVEGYGGGTLGIRFTNRDNNTNCITTRCMAWEVVDEIYGYCLRMNR